MARIDSHISKALLGSIAILGLFAGPPALAGGQSGAPELTKVVYERSNDSLDRRTDVEVFGRRIESLTIRASFDGETASSPTTQDRSNSGHPWVPRYHDPGRRRLLNLMEDSIEATGAVTLKLIARNEAGRTRESAEIVFSECHTEPPIYPFTCIVES